MGDRAVLTIADLLSPLRGSARSLCAVIPRLGSCERISQPVILSEAKDLALPMEVADGEGTQSEILRSAQNDSACIFLPFPIFSHLLTPGVTNADCHNEVKESRSADGSG